MTRFGLISSFYDMALILPLIFIFKTHTELFRTAWFIESTLSEIVITFAIRSKLPFYKSKPSSILLGMSLAAIVITIGFTYTAFGNNFFQFVQTPPLILLFIFGILAAYFITAEIAKRILFKKFDI